MDFMDASQCVVVVPSDFVQNSLIQEEQEPTQLSDINGSEEDLSTDEDDSSTDEEGIS